MIGLDALQGIDGNLDNFMRGFGSHFLDVHSPGLAGHNNDLGNRPVGNNAQVQLFGNIQTLLHQNLFNFLPLGPGLLGNQIHPDDLPGNTVNLLLGLGQFDPPALAPAPGVNLSFNHNRVSSQSFGDPDCFIGTKRHPTLRRGHAVFSEEFLGLVFVDFHLQVSFRERSNYMK